MYISRGQSPTIATSNVWRYNRGLTFWLIHVVDWLQRRPNSGFQYKNYNTFDQRKRARQQCVEQKFEYIITNEDSTIRERFHKICNSRITVQRRYAKQTNATMNHEKDYRTSRYR